VGKSSKAFLHSGDNQTAKVFGVADRRILRRDTLPPVFRVSGVTMRLTPDQRERILRAVHDHVGSDAAVWLYGSRAGDTGRGGDIDLLIHPARAVDVHRQAALHARLEQDLLLPVDLSFVDPGRGMNRFQRLVAADAVPLEAP
jgi:predicted nucleotidyltransferase